MPATPPRPKMSNAAYAGFLRMLLTPLHEAPTICPEVEAYLRYVSRVQDREVPGQAAA